MKDIVIHLRAMHLFTHNAHLLCSRMVFFQDHAFFGETYAALEDSYDGVFERMVGLYGEDSVPSLQEIVGAVGVKLQNAPSKGVKENFAFYSQLLAMETELCALIAKSLSIKVSAGVEQLLGEECNKSEARQYKIKQRMKK